MKANRLAGHELPNEGRVRVDHFRYGNGPGRARCACGEKSPALPNTAQRKQWHRDHKDSVRAAANLGHGGVK